MGLPSRLKRDSFCANPTGRAVTGNILRVLSSSISISTQGAATSYVSVLAPGCAVDAWRIRSQCELQRLNVRTTTVGEGLRPRQLPVSAMNPFPPRPQLIATWRRVSTRGKRSRSICTEKCEPYSGGRNAKVCRCIAINIRRVRRFSRSNTRWMSGRAVGARAEHSARPGHRIQVPRL